MRNDIEVYYQRVKKALCRREVLQTIASVLVVISIFHFITRPKVIHKDVVRYKTEYVDKVVKVDKIVEVDRVVEVEVEKIVEIEKIVEAPTIVEQTDNDLEFGEMFNKERERLGANQIFLWRNKYYSTNYEEE
tara:strand:- start:132 stop:530 length:399 start_codon:yes stop_codon:yes gene_type:complete